MTTTPARLYDSDTTEDLGPATPEQVAASDESAYNGQLGHILIDTDGDVVPDGSQTSGSARRVYAE